MSSPPPGPPLPDPLDSLRLDAEQVSTAADFHESYARLVLQNTDQRRDDFEAALIEAASAYRLAGQWRLLVDPVVGVKLLLTSASLLDQADLMYGSFLHASLAPDRVRDKSDAWTRRLLRTDGRPYDEPAAPTVVGAYPAGERPAPAREPDAILDHVQQQTYLLLACAALTTPGSRQATQLRAFAARSSHRAGVVPMGSMAVPVRTFWGLALDMLSPEDESAARSYAGTLTELSRAYARTVDLAMANTLTWFNAAAPIDVADLDVIGTVAMGVRRFGLDRMQGLLLTDGVELPDVALVPLDLGREVADLDVPPRGEPDLGPRPPHWAADMDVLPDDTDLTGPVDMPGSDDLGPDDLGPEDRGPDLGGP
ncbi:hypothetical protein ACFWIJ_05985 [Streptomyces sp. NPDC127079]|uniref:hypothetical protein n=1 Tax=Streptomyces sp. NPDC127079 TaxID=3347132 RepID=UPI00365AAA37